MIGWKAFSPSNPNHIKLYCKDVKGLERPKRPAVRTEFVELGCLCIHTEKANLQAVINVNIQDDDTQWIDVVSEFLTIKFNNSIINGYFFEVENTKNYISSPTLYFQNIRVSVNK